jgi:hypothetical protein
MTGMVEGSVNATPDAGGRATTATAGGQGESDEKEGDEQRFHTTQYRIMCPAQVWHNYAMYSRNRPPKMAPTRQKLSWRPKWPSLYMTMA